MKKATRMLSMAAAFSFVLAGTVGTAGAHGPVVLKDKAGNTIPLAGRASGQPVSTEKTCGGCHDYATRSAAFHVQQGGNEYNKAADDGNNYVVSGRAFVYSPGMIGKW